MGIEEADLTPLLRCGACLRLLSDPGASVMHMQGVGGRVVCGEKAVQVWAVVSIEDAQALQQRITELESRHETDEGETDGR